MLRAIYGPAQGDTKPNGHKHDGIAHLTEYDLEGVYGGLCQPNFDEEIAGFGLDLLRDL